MKEESRMLVVPENPDDILPDAFIKRASAGGAVTLKNMEKGENNILKLTLQVSGRTHEVRIYISDISVPDFFRTEHFFSDLDFQKIDKVGVSVAVEMDYNENFLETYHDQLKIIDYLVPDKLAVFDIPSEKILSGKWVKLAAQSAVPPAPKYLFTVQAVCTEGDEVWLHTHGLKRCGLTELEIMGSSRETYNSHYSVMETLAVRMLENEAAPEGYEPVFVAWLTERIAMVAALVDWKDAQQYYPGAKLGTEADRDDWHSEGTSVILIYPGPDAAENRKPAPVQLLDDYLGTNTLLMISNTETERMRKLAQERISYVKKAADSHSDIHILMKIGLKVDREFITPDDPDQREHIWFELEEYSGDMFRCVLTQEPYYVKSMHEGSHGTYSLEDVTDWMIMAGDRRYTPDDAYLM